MCVMRHDNTCNKYTSLLKQMHKFTQVNKHNRLAYENCMLTKLQSTTVHYVPLCTSFLHAGGPSYWPMQNFYIANHSTGLLVVNTGCNTKMVETCEK